MNISGRDIYIVLNNGLWKKIQNITPYDYLIGIDGNSYKVDTIQKHQGVLYKIKLYNDYFLVPGQQSLSLMCIKDNELYKKNQILKLHCENISNLPSEILDCLRIIKNGITHFSTIDMSLPMNIAFFGKWLVATDIQDLNKKLKTHKKKALDEIIKKYNLSNDNRFIPNCIFTSSLEQRFSLLRGILNYLKSDVKI